MAVNPTGPGAPGGQPPGGGGGFTQGAVRAGAVGEGGGGGRGPGIGKPGKPFGGLMSSEFAVWLLTALLVCLAGLLADDIEPITVWTLVTALSFAFIISRGLAKHEHRSGHGDDYHA